MIQHIQEISNDIDEQREKLMLIGSKKTESAVLLAVSMIVLTTCFLLDMNYPAQAIGAALTLFSFFRYRMVSSKCSLITDLLKQNMSYKESIIAENYSGDEHPI